IRQSATETIECSQGRPSDPIPSPVLTFEAHDLRPGPRGVPRTRDLAHPGPAVRRAGPVAHHPGYRRLRGPDGAPGASDPPGRAHAAPAAVDRPFGRALPRCPRLPEAPPPSRAG